MARPSFSGLHKVLWYGTAGCFAPEEWLKQNKSETKRYEIRKAIKAALESGVCPIWPVEKWNKEKNSAHGYTLESPFILAALDENGAFVQLIPILEFDSSKVCLFDGQKITIDRYNELSLTGALEEKESNEPKSDAELFADAMGWRHGFDYSHLNGKHIYIYRPSKFEEASELTKKMVEVSQKLNFLVTLDVQGENAGTITVENLNGSI